MHWTAYEVFTLISGIILIVVAVLPAMTPKERLWAVVGGAGFIGYAIFVANQTSGTWYFPVQIFILPPIAAIYAIVTAVQHYRRQAADRGPRLRRDVEN